MYRVRYSRFCSHRSPLPSTSTRYTSPFYDEEGKPIYETLIIYLGKVCNNPTQPQRWYTWITTDWTMVSQVLLKDEWELLGSICHEPRRRCQGKRKLHNSIHTFIHLGRFKYLSSLRAPRLEERGWFERWNGNFGCAWNLQV